MQTRLFRLDPALPEDVILDRMRRWKARARALGGDVWRVTRLELGVALPDHVPVRGGEPLTAFVADRRRP